ncbi:hypothetical protein P7K49_000020, partial [Saguinus oedipus]
TTWTLAKRRPCEVLNGISNPRSTERLPGFLLLGLEDFFSHRSNSGSPDLSTEMTGTSAPCMNLEEPPDPEHENLQNSAKQGASPEGCSGDPLEALPVQQEQSANKMCSI